MKRLCIAVGLAVFSGNAAAEWALVSRNMEFLAYADRVTSKRTGSIVRMWILHDQITPQVIEDRVYLSSEMQNEYDCKEKQWRQIYVLRYSGRMGAGRTFPFHTSSAQWRSVLPGTAIEAEWSFACKKR